MSTQSSPKIGLTTATIVGMNAMIGAGIFAAPALLASSVGPVGIVLYIGVVLSVWCMALSLARLAALFPQEGSFYTYAKQWGGHWIGLLASGLYLVGLVIAMGLLSQTAGSYIGHFFPTYSSTVLGFIVLLALVLLNMCGVVLSELGQQILIVCTLFPLLATTLLCFLHADIHNLFPFAPYGFGTNLLNATRLVIFGFFGFECAASLFNVVENPKRNVPRALTYSIIIVGLVYTLFIASLILSTPLVLFNNPLMPLSTILNMRFPGNYWLIMMIHMSILSAIVGTIHSMIWSSSSLALSLGSIGSKAIRLYTKQWPAFAQRIAVFCIGIGITTTFFSLSNLDLFFSCTALFIIASFILSFITLLTIQSEWRNGHNIIVIIGMSTAFIILYFALQGLLKALYIS
ncbi:MAG TPA: amino acid permease [Candidatus Babeliales bacterium]|jgi:APA family basic amino acid/polyamine antiporter|nr:amino acid permease [Candidatus Babeliales bacterium]